jgi:hydrogenase nickel incorporation protein HypB
VCVTCGCGEAAHDHGHAVETTRLVRIERDILGRNDVLAERNRRWISERGIYALNLVSSPGAGKTTLLERTIRELGSERRMAVIEGDQETENDAARIRATGCPVVQLNTGKGCHLDAAMVARGLSELSPVEGSLLVIENVGNLVCPALFDLGEHVKVLVASVTEGDDKPAKYPHAFRASSLVLLNKVDLLPYVSFDVPRFVQHAHEANPHLRVIPLSATTGEGIAEWYRWLRQQRHWTG